MAMIKGDYKIRYLFTKPLGNLLLGCFWLFLVFLMFQLHHDDGLQKKLSEAYRVAQGKVLKSKVDKIVIASGTSRKIRWEVNIQYKYRVDGVEYEGSRVRYNGPRKRFFYEEDAKLLVQKFPEGPVDVYYDPEDPSVAVLDNSNVEEYAKATIENISVFVFLATLFFVVGAMRFFLNRRNGQPV